MPEAKWPVLIDMRKWFIIPTILFEIYPGKYYLSFLWLRYRKEIQWMKG